MPFKKGQSGNIKGRPKGRKDNATLDKEAAREALRQMVTAELAPMTQAQIKHAKGISFLVYRDKKGGKFTKITAEQAEAIFAQEGEDVVIEVWEKEPSIQAYTDLMNRTLDKPTETLQAQVTVTGKVDAIIQAARGRLARTRRGNGHSTHA